MSILKTNAITDASGGNTATINGYTPTMSNMAGRNRIINGDMRIDQRNAGASVATSTGNSTYTLDRWETLYAQTSKYTVQQNAGAVTPPAGFTSYLGVTSLSAYSVTSSDYFNILQKVEGFNVADFGWGTANAQPVTLSFWVRSSLTGNFGGAFQNGAQTRSYPFTYTVTAANTWEYKTVTVLGDTTGTWLTNNGKGMWIILNLGAGSNYEGTANTWTAANRTNPTGAVSVVGTNGATFYITGVQLEAGSVATPFERRQYGQELALCQRYYQVLAKGYNKPMSIGAAYTATSVYIVIQFRTTMRVPPTFSATSGTNYYIFYRSAGGDLFNSLTLEQASTDAIELSNGTDISGTAGWSGMTRTNNENSFITLNSEL